MATGLTTQVAEREKRDGVFAASLDGRQLLCTSRHPFLDSARVLLAEGVPPQTRLTMCHVGSFANSLTATVGAAAKLTVDESGPRFAKWQAWSPLEGPRAPDGSVQDALEAAAG
jgi:hypothetical protein